MRRREPAARVLVLVSLALCSACGVGSGHEATSECGQPRPSDVGAPVVLVACHADPVGAPSVFFVGIANVSDNPVQVAARLEPFAQFSVRAADASGRELEPANIWESASIGLERSTHLLPRGGVFGRWIDLACGTPDFGRDLGCLSMFDWPDGEVTIWFEYEDATVCLREPCDPGDLWSGSLRSEEYVIRLPS